MLRFIYHHPLRRSQESQIFTQAHYLGQPYTTEINHILAEHVTYQLYVFPMNFCQRKAFTVPNIFKFLAKIFLDTGIKPTKQSLI